MKYTVEYTRKNGSFGKRTIEAESFSKVATVLKAEVRDFLGIKSVAVL